jgi:hypothetical protein
MFSTDRVQEYSSPEFDSEKRHGLKTNPEEFKGSASTTHFFKDT